MKGRFFKVGATCPWASSSVCSDRNSAKINGTTVVQLGADIQALKMPSRAATANPGLQQQLQQTNQQLQQSDTTGADPASSSNRRSRLRERQTKAAATVYSAPSSSVVN